MAINIITGFRSSSREALDKRLGPYASVADALAALDEAIDRYVGLKVVIVDNAVTDPAGNFIEGDITKYIFDGGITDAHLVPDINGITSVSWGDIQGTLANQTDLQTALDAKFDESEHIDTSGGAADAGKPIILNSSGQIDPSMLDASTFYYVGPWDPSGGTEYPDTTGESHGAFWVVQGLSGTYTFTGGDLSGQDIDNGDFMVWGTGGWSIMRGEMNPLLYMKLDKSTPLDANSQPLIVNGRVSNITVGGSSGDAVEFDQFIGAINNLDADIATKVSKTGDVMTGSLAAEGYIRVKGNTSGAGAFQMHHTDDTAAGSIHHSIADYPNGLKIKLFSNDGLTVTKTLELHDSGVSIDGDEIWDAGNFIPSSKENSLGNPTSDGMILSSTVAGVRTWIDAPNSAVWGSITGTLSNQTDLQDALNLKADLTYVDTGLAGKAEVVHIHVIGDVTDLQTELNDRYTKGEHVYESTGTNDAFKPITLNSTGQIDPSMIDASTFYYVGTWDPSDPDGPNDDSSGCDPVYGCEYPDTTNESHGAFWVVDQLENPVNPTDPVTDYYYTFQSGDLAGMDIRVGDFMVWGTGGWSIMRGEMNPTLYYKLDGSQPLTNHFQAGGYQLKNIANGTDGQDACSMAQYNTVDGKIDTHIADTANPHSVTKTQVGLGNVDDTADADKPISTATQAALDDKAALVHIHSKQDEMLTETEIEANIAVGGVEVGDTFPIGTPLELIIRKILVALIMPVIEADASASIALDTMTAAYYEVGTDMADTTTSSKSPGTIRNGDGTTTPLKGTDNGGTYSIAAPGDSTVAVDASGNVTGNLGKGSHTISFIVEFLEGTAPYYDSEGTAITDPAIDAERNAETITGTDVVDGILPKMYGMSATDFAADPTDLYADLTHDLTPTENGDISYSINGTNAYIYFVVDNTKRISKIIDGNGFDVTGSFTVHAVTIVSPLWSYEMYIYKTNSLTSVDPAQNYTITISNA